MSRNYGAMASVNVEPTYLRNPSFSKAHVNDRPSFLIYRLQTEEQVLPTSHKMTIQQPAAFRFDDSWPRMKVDAMVDDCHHGHAEHYTRPPLDTHSGFNNPTRYSEDEGLSRRHITSPPLYQQAMPATFSFRPMSPCEQNALAGLSGALNSATPPPKIESSPSLPTPMVLSKDVDVSKYEGVPFNDWLMAPVDYDLSFAPSNDTTGVSQFSAGFEDGQSFVDYYFGKNSRLFPPEYSPISASYTSSFDGTIDSEYSVSLGSATSASSSWSDNMFEHPMTVPSTWVSTSYTVNEPASVSPRDIQRPSSSQSDSANSTASSSHLEHTKRFSIEARHQRDELLVEMRRNGHAYKAIKRLGRFKEAESTLRGRVRMLTKQKSERVRRPQWKANDVR